MTKAKKTKEDIVYSGDIVKLIPSDDIFEFVDSDNYNTKDNYDEDGELKL